MMLRKTMLGKTWKLTRQKVLRIKKELYQRRFCRETIPKRILLIVGCQRSGTTLVWEVFANDLRTAVLQEESCITRPDSLRLKPLPEVNRIVSSFRAPLIVAKPLVETQWTPEMLSDIAGAKALWMFRNFYDVVSSNVKQFHSQVEGLRIAITGYPPNWRNERLSGETHSILRRYFHEGMNRADAAALGWYLRNILFFELGLERHADVLLCKYEDFVTKPSHVISRIYLHIGLDKPRRAITRDVDARSIGLGDKVRINREIAALCDELMDRLDHCYCEQWELT